MSYSSYTFKQSGFQQGRASSPAQQQQQAQVGQSPAASTGMATNEDLQRYQQALAQREFYNRQRQQQQQQQQQPLSSSSSSSSVAAIASGYQQFTSDQQLSRQNSQSGPQIVPQQQMIAQKSATLQQQQVSQELSDPVAILNLLKELEKQVPEDEENAEMIKELKEVIQKDAKSELVVKKSAMKLRDLLQKKKIYIDYCNQILPIRQAKPGNIFDGGYSGYGNSWTGNQFRVTYPKERRRHDRTAREINFSAAQLDAIANASEDLIPIRLDVELDTHRLHDCFTWNVNEKMVSVSQFAEHLVEDFHLPLSTASHVTASMNEQISDYHPHAFCDISEPKYASSTSIYRDEDMRIIIKLDITVGQHNLIDKFEWDMNCSENSPEEFAETLCQELNLSGEFCTAIAHAIREQQQIFTKSLFLAGHPFDGTMISDEDIRREFCPPITDFLRSKGHSKEFQPVLFEVDDAELDRQDRDRDRESRRKRRQGRAGRRGGPALPDFTEIVRTFRSPVYSSMLPGGVDRNRELMRKATEKQTDPEDEETTSISTPNPTSTPQYIPGPPRRGRPSKAQLAAAAAAGQAGIDINGRLHLNRGAIQQDLIRQQALQHRGSPETYIIKLKVPRLKQFLARKYGSLHR